MLADNPGRNDQQPARDMEPVAPDRPDGRLDANVGRLTRDLADAAEQQAALAEVLETMGRSPVALEPVFDTVVRHALHLCSADAALIWQLDGAVYRLRVALGGSAEYREYLAAHPVACTPGTLVGRVALNRRTVQIPDVDADPDYEWRRSSQLGGVRTLLGVPMLVEDRVVGVLVLCRHDVEPFDERSIGVVTTFAAQAAIAIQSVSLVHELERSVDRLGALGEVSQAVNSSLDLDEVLTRIVTYAVELSRADGGSIFEFEPATREFALRTCAGTSDACEHALRAIRIPLGETFIGRAALDGVALQSADLDAEPPDPHVEALRSHGWRSMVAVPLRREGEILGALVARRRTPGKLPPEELELLETLADQSSVAIVNARVYRQLEDKRRQLEVASGHKSEFLASMSHELRTPLNAVIGFSDVLLDRMAGELNERQDEYVREIRDSGRHLLELINDILDLSRVESGRMELDRHSVWLPGVLEQSLAMVRQRAVQHGISLAVHVAPDVATVAADELKLKQVLLNLLTNAVKFTPDGGAVTVAAHADGAMAQISVRDTGVGIAEAEQEAIFETFQRGGRAARSGAEGTGLGLTLSRRIVELHGGRLWVESRPGAGSTFSFTLPLDRPAEPDEPEPETPAGPPTAGDPVLVVEDDRRSANLLRVQLERAGYAVTVTGDGAEGLALAQRLRPRAVILDIVLPGLDGWDLLARLKGDAATAAIPVVVVSILDERDAGFALGAAEYLIKPVSRDALLEALDRCAAPPPARRTVVVIDDDPRQLELVETTLAPAGWAVLRAAGGAEGVAVVRRERPALVLLDLLMPDTDGFEVVEQLRADPALAGVPIVVLTAKDMTDADHERLNGRISHLARKGTLSPAGIVALVDRLATPAAVPLGGAS
jgi:signal transduction histidine kinase/CheY-like chemotaxis protein